MDADEEALLAYTWANRGPIAEQTREQAASAWWTVVALVVMGLFGLWIFALPLLIVANWLGDCLNGKC